MNHPSGGSLRQRFQEDLVGPGSFVIRMEEKMGVAFDQPGEKGEAREIHLTGSVGSHDG
jgi:hypothetical protein